MNDLVRDKLMTESGDITMGAEILAGATVSVSFEIAIYILALLIVFFFLNRLVHRRSCSQIHLRLLRFVYKWPAK